VNESLQFIAEGSANVVWTATLGTVTSTGLYTAPASSEKGFDQITATDAQDSTKTATFVLKLITQPVSISGPSTPVYAYSTVKFTANVNPYYSDPSVTWTASAGSIAEDGTYTAPLTPMSVTITATLKANPKQVATLKVVIH
jgi:hypothetical protein